MSALRIVAAFVRRDFRINISYRASFALEAVSTLFVLALFFYLSRVVDEAQVATSQDLKGGYFGYATVGIAVLTIVQVSLSSFSRQLREEQTTGTFEALMATPASPSLIVLSSAVYDLLRGTLTAAVMMVAAVALFGLRLEVDPASIGTAAVALVGCLGLFASLGVAVAAFTVLFKRTTALLGMVISGLALLGGVYFPIDVFPEPLQVLANALPFTWGVDVLRASLLGGNVDPAQLAGLYGSAVALLPPALIGFTLATRRARRTGGLAQY
jgi:ABC-2 type transport system permease protein